MSNEEVKFQKMTPAQDDILASICSEVKHALSLGVSLETIKGQLDLAADEYIEATNKAGGIKFPQVEVQLSGEDGNAFGIIGRVSKAMKRAGIDKADIDAYTSEAMSDDYNHLLNVTMNTVKVS